MKIERLNGGRRNGWEGSKSAKHRFWGSVFPKDLNVSDARVFHPLDDRLVAWNKLFVISCMIAVCVDPFLFFFPSIRRLECVAVNMEFTLTIIFLRTTVDAFYLIHMYFEFHTAYRLKVMGTNKIVTDPKCIATKYWREFFLVDLLSVLPFPQIAILLCFLDDTATPKAMKAVLSIVLLQYAPRFLRVYPLTIEVQRSSGAFPNSSLAGAVYYLLWYLLVSHILGSTWYLLGVERNFSCLRKACSNNKLCDEAYLYCFYQQRQGSFSSTKIIENILNSCSISAENPPVTFGIYKEALANGVFTTWKFLSLYLYCFWWGLKNLSTLGQGLQTGIYAGEIIFTVLITISGVLHSAYLIGNMHTSTYLFQSLLVQLDSIYQNGVEPITAYKLASGFLVTLLVKTSTPPDVNVLSVKTPSHLKLKGTSVASYLQSFTTRLEELRNKKCEMEQWMHRRLLPQDLRQRVGRYNQYRWWETGGMDEETLLQSLPRDIRRDVKRHLCMDMIKKVPLFGLMDDQLLDAFCERLKSSLYTEGAYIVHEGDPVNEMVFITHGRLESVTTGGGGSKFINQSILKEGDFCGEELLLWALDPRTGSILPSSTRMVQALTEVEAFTTTPEDLKFLARQFKCLHTQQAKNLFRFYSQHWRTWAARCIQGAWRRYSERKRVLNRHSEASDSSGSSPSLASTLYAFRFIHALRGVRLEKPPEPDFTSDTD